MSDKNLINKIDLKNIPQHVAIIMDGNGRWAKKKNLPRVFGHKAGIKSVKEITNAAVDIGVKYLTLYAFSTENWLRPETEVQFLMNLMYLYLKKEAQEMKKNGVKMITTGDISKLPKQVQKVIENTCAVTKDCDKLVLNLCLNYGGRQEIVSAVNKIISLKIEHVTEESFQNFLLNDLPYPDLLIRTSGEVRISNFLLWQIAYSEFYFTEVFWPDFNKSEFFKAIIIYQNRQRRYGKV